MAISCDLILLDCTNIDIDHFLSGFLLLLKVRFDIILYGIYGKGKVYQRDADHQ